MCLCSLEYVLTREFRGSDAESGENQRLKESVVGQGMCFSRGMCVKGPGTREGGLVWVASF